MIQPAPFTDTDAQFLTAVSEGMAAHAKAIAAIAESAQHIEITEEGHAAAIQSHAELIKLSRILRTAWEDRTGDVLPEPKEDGTEERANS